MLVHKIDVIINQRFPLKRFKSLTFLISFLFLSNTFSFASIPNIHINHLNTNYALTSQGYSNLNDVNSNHIGSNIQKPNELTKSTILSSLEYNSLDKSKGADRQLNQNEISVIEKHGTIFAKQLYGENPTEREIKDATARLAQEALRGVDAEWSLILGGGKEYDKEARTFLSSYNGMFQAKDKFEFNDGTTDGTYSLRLMTNEEKQNIKDFTSQYAYMPTSSDIEQQSIYDAYIPYHDENMIDGVLGVFKTAADLVDNPFGSIAKAGVAIYDGTVKNHIVGSIEGSVTFGELWLSPTLGQDVIDIYGQGQSGLGVQKFLHTGEALETGSYLFGVTAARTTAVKTAESTASARVTATGVELNAKLPEPVAGLDYMPKTLDNANPNIANSHVTGYASELKTANEISKLPNQQVISYGDAVGTHGSDIISVNTKTGEVTLWDSKYRSSSTSIQSSPTFTNPSAFENARRQAIEILEKDTTLPSNIKNKALENLDKRNVITNTVGSGNAKNSVTVKLCNGKPCN